MAEIAINPTHNVFKKYKEVIYVNPFLAGMFDTDAQAFIIASAISDSIQKNAINNLVISLKSDGLWVKMKAIYPFVGGNAFAHKFNLKSPIDDNANFRIFFNGGWTHSLTGAKPDGTTGFGNIFLIPLNSLTLYNISISFYSKTNTLSSSGIEIGTHGDNSNISLLSIIAPRIGGVAYATHVGQTNASDTASPSGLSDALGFFVSSRISSSPSSLKFFKNGIALASATTNTGTYVLPDKPIYIGAYNGNGNALGFSNKECAFASIGDGLTDSEALNFNNIVQAYQTALGRQV